MKKTLLIALLFATSIPVTASAAVTVSIDMDTSKAGIQDTRRVLDGELFDIGIVVSVTDASTLGAYTFSVRLDDTELNYSDFDPTLPSGFTSGGDPTETSGGDDRQDGMGDVPFLQIAPISAFDLESGGVGAGDYQIGTMQLVVDTATNDAFLDILPGIFRLADEFADGDLNDITGQVSFNAGTITAVPEPGTWAVLGLASAGVAIRRVRRGKLAWRASRPDARA